MPHQKTSEAVYKTVRFNPATSSEDKEVVETVKRLEAQGFNFHQVVVDAILRAGDWTPEMFPKPNTPDMVVLMEGLLSNFAQEIIAEIHKRGFGTVASDGFTESGDTTEFASNFAKSFMQRQQRALGDKD